MMAVDLRDSGTFADPMRIRRLLFPELQASAGVPASRDQDGWQHDDEDEEADEAATAHRQDTQVSRQL